MPCGAAAAFLHPGNQLALAVGLAEIDGQPELLGGFGAELLHVVQRGAAVECGWRRPSMFMFGPFSTATRGGDAD